MEVEAEQCAYFSNTSFANPCIAKLLEVFSPKNSGDTRIFLVVQKFSLRKRISKRGCGISLCKAMLSLNWITYKSELFAEQNILQKRLQNDLAFIKIVNQFALKLNRYTKNEKSNLAP